MIQWDVSPLDKPPARPPPQQPQKAPKQEDPVDLLFAQLDEEIGTLVEAQINIAEAAPTKQVSAPPNADRGRGSPKPGTKASSPVPQQPAAKDSPFGPRLKKTEIPNKDAAAPLKVSSPPTKESPFGPKVVLKKAEPPVEKVEQAEAKTGQPIVVDANKQQAQISALKVKLKAAAEAEDYETAAELKLQVEALTKQLEAQNQQPTKQTENPSQPPKQIETAAKQTNAPTKSPGPLRSTNPSLANPSNAPPTNAPVKFSQLKKTEPPTNPQAQPTLGPATKSTTPLKKTLSEQIPTKSDWDTLATPPSNHPTHAPANIPPPNNPTTAPTNIPANTPANAPVKFAQLKKTEPPTNPQAQPTPGLATKANIPVKKALSEPATKVEPGSPEPSIGAPAKVVKQAVAPAAGPALKKTELSSPPAQVPVLTKTPTAENLVGAPAAQEAPPESPPMGRGRGVPGPGPNPAGLLDVFVLTSNSKGSWESNAGSFEFVRILQSTRPRKCCCCASSSRKRKQVCFFLRCPVQSRDRNSGYRWSPCS